jgi:NAD(P)H-hydrate repair Nnr-like enzyme with NAD(P)H-hydrate dehydratase domain
VLAGIKGAQFKLLDRTPVQVGGASAAVGHDMIALGVLAGIVAGLLARGAEPAQAAVWGAWLHGTAGDRLAAASGPVGFLVRELAPLVPGLVAEVAG